MVTNLPMHDTFDRRRCAILTLLFLVVAAAGAPPGAAAQDVPADGGASAETEGPLVAVDPIHDFGNLIKGQVETHAFVLRNTGSEPLTIERAFPSCGCTVAEFDRTIPPGGEGKVHAVLDTTGITGKGTTAIGIFVEGDSEPAAVLQLAYDVSPKLLAHPGYARWIYVQHEEQGTIAQTVYANDSADFEVVSVEPPMSAIDVSFREAEPAERQEGFAGKQWVVSATLGAEAPAGPIEGFIDVHTTHPLQQVVRIPVSGFVRPALFVSPQDRDFGTLELSTPRTASYTIRNFASKPIALTSAETDVPGVTAYVEPIEEGRNYKLVVQFDPAAMEEGPFDGAVRIATDSEAVPTLTVELEGTLVRRTADSAN